MFDEATSALDNLTQKQVSDSLDKLNDLTFAVENGSAGQAAVVDLGIAENQIIAVQDQAAALMEVAAGYTIVLQMRS